MNTYYFSLSFGLISLSLFSFSEILPAASSNKKTFSRRNLLPNLVCSIDDLNRNHLLPNNKEKQRTLFIWLLNALHLQDTLIETHYKSVLFDKKRARLQREVDEIFRSFLENKTFYQQSNGVITGRIHLKNPESEKIWNTYETIIQSRNSDQIDQLQAIIDQYKKNSHHEIKKIICYLKKIIEIERLNSFKQEHIAPPIGQSLLSFTKLMQSDYKEYLEINTFTFMNATFLAMQKWLKICDMKQQDGTFSEYEQKEDTQLYTDIVNYHTYYQNILHKINTFKHELEKATHVLESKAKKRNPNDFFHRFDKDLGKKYQKRSEDQKSHSCK